MGVVVDLLEEIRTRIVRDTASGKPLASIKNVLVGSVEQTTKDQNLPRINIRLVDINNTGIGQGQFANNQSTDELGIEIDILDNKKALANNKLYDTNTSTGALYMYEKVLNAIELNTSNKPDLTFNNKAYNLIVNSTSFSEDLGLYIVTIKITIRTRIFTRGAR